MKNKVYLMAIFMLAVAMVLVGCNGAADADDTGPIKIGLVMPRSGSLAMLGSEAVQGAEIARDIVNEAGGVNGREIVFVEADAPGPTEASAEANRLIDQESVNIIIGSLSSGNGSAISSVTEKNQALLWETSAIADSITDNGQYIYRTCESGRLRGYYAMQFISEELPEKLGIPKEEIRVALINEDSSYGESIVEGATDGAEEYGINLVMHERYNQDISDFSATVVRLKESKPDIVFAVSYVNDAVLLYDTLQQMDAMPKLLIGGGSGFTDLNFVQVFEADADGVIVVDMPTNIPPENFQDQKTKDLQQEFRSRYLEKNAGKESVPLTAEVLFAGTYVLLNDVLPNAESTSTVDVVEAAKNLDLKETTMGWGVKFDENGQNEIAIPAISQWQEGKTVAVWPELYKTSDLQLR